MTEETWQITLQVLFARQSYIDWIINKSVVDLFYNASGGAVLWTPRETLYLMLMDFSEFLNEVVSYASGIKLLEFSGLVFGLLCVWFLIKQNILTWPMGIIYVLISFVIFLRAKLYADFILHIFFLILNIYGWYYWVTPGRKDQHQVPVTRAASSQLFWVLLLSAFGIAGSGYLLSNLTDASVPYWDSATSVLSIAAMWLTAKKKIENWVLWLVVDVLATGIYFYKGLYFYCLLYMVYIGMALVGYFAWKRSLEMNPVRA